MSIDQKVKELLKVVSPHIRMYLMVIPYDNISIKNLISILNKVFGSKMICSLLNYDI